MDKGILYITGGDDYVLEAAQSARSIKNKLSDIDITIITDAEEVPDVFDSRMELDDPEYSFIDKVSNMSRSPYEKTIFLDTDTYLHDKRGVTDLFDLLDEFDFAACHALGRRLEVSVKEGNPIPDVPVPPSFSWFNSGVLAFNDDEAVDEVFENWNRIYRSHRSMNPNIPDQGALRQALYYSDVRIATLPFEYNYHVLFPQAVGDKVRLLHGHIDNFEEVAETVNEEPETIRYFHAVGGERTAYLWTTTDWGNRARKVYLSVKMRGPVSTAVGILSYITGGKFWSS